MAGHAFLSPSGAAAWMLCHAKPWREAPFPDSTSKAAAEGTVAHAIAARCLQEAAPASSFIGETFVEDGFSFTVDAAMAQFIQDYVDCVLGMAGAGDVMVEQVLDLSGVTGEDSSGTADAIVLQHGVLAITDLKFGMGLRVDAECNPQLRIYGLAALQQFEAVEDIHTVVMTIVQPRLAHSSSESLSAGDLRRWGKDLRITADRIMAGEDLEAVPGDKQCRFCRAKGDCPELRRQALVTIANDFEDLTPLPFNERITAAIERLPGTDSETLAGMMPWLDLIQDWASAVRSEVERRMFDGQAMPGYKLVEGKRGNRKWANETEAEAQLKAMRLKVEEMFDLKLISPTTAEKLHKAGVIGPRQWPRIQQLITQSAGGPAVAPVADKRLAITVGASADDFEVLTQE